MSDELNFVELDGQQVELLPARIVLSMFSQGSNGGTGGKGDDAMGSLGITMLGKQLLPGGGNATGMSGADASGS